VLRRCRPQDDGFGLFKGDFLCGFFAAGGDAGGVGFGRGQFFFELLQVGDEGDFFGGFFFQMVGGKGGFQVAADIIDADAFGFGFMPVVV
jgi:hypothetical protein